MLTELKAIELNEIISKKASLYILKILGHIKLQYYQFNSTCYFEIIHVQ